MENMWRYPNRYEAGKVLAEFLKNFKNKKDALVLALPRGGVPVGYEIACSLSIPLDILIVRKIGVPYQEELAMGAIASDGMIILNDKIIKELKIKKNLINAVIKKEQAEIERRQWMYHSNRSLTLNNKHVILVDDGIATGATVQVAIKAIYQKKPKTITVAIPVASEDACLEIEKMVDKLVCPIREKNFQAVGFWYEDFPQTTDKEVFDLLNQ